MKKNLLVAFLCIALLFAAPNTNAQSLKVGVFDIDLMVQAMPGYRIVDSLVRIYEADSLAVEYEYYQLEYQRLDSTYKADSGLVAAGKKSKALLDFTNEERRKMAINIVYWQQISQNKSNSKRSQYAQPLYQVISGAYRKILEKKKYTLILKPQTYEAGFPIDNIFLSMARELKLQGLPQELLYLGDDPDAVKQPAKPATGTKPKTK
ncbi:MAG: OmpH family outer membrane protein [Bacteroidota bacterium]